MATYEGFDVSQWNGAVDMKKAKAAGKSFVMIRSSYGDVASYPRQKDLRFDENVANAKAAGLNFGVYHYMYASTVAAAKTEAKGFVALLDKVKPIPYFVALDVEESYQYNMAQSDLQAIVKAFIDVVEKAGYFCALYSYEAMLNRMSSEFRSKYAIWCANISTRPGITYGVHQYSFTGNINGLNGAVDLNRTTTDYPSIIKKAGLNGYKKPAATKKPTTKKPAATKKPATTKKPTTKKPTTKKPATTKKTTAITYRIKPGDNLTDIAKKFGTTVAKIAKDNRIKDVNLIYAGKDLIIKK